MNLITYTLGGSLSPQQAKDLLSLLWVNGLISEIRYGETTKDLFRFAQNHQLVFEYDYSETSDEEFLDLEDDLINRFGLDMDKQVTSDNHSTYIEMNRPGIHSREFCIDENGGIVVRSFDIRKAIRNSNGRDDLVDNLLLLIGDDIPGIRPFEVIDP